MRQFDFNIDEKCTVWYRSCFSVKAETMEEAKMIATKMVKNKNYSSEWEVLFDTSENISPDDNYGQPTQELYLNDTRVWDNLT